MNKYDLNISLHESDTSLWASLKKFLPFLKADKGHIIFATLCAFITS